MDQTEKIYHRKILRMQQEEITEHKIYRYLAKRQKDSKIKHILEEIGADELKHYAMFKKFTGKDVRPNYLKVLYYRFLGVFFGVTFTTKLLEMGEAKAQVVYEMLDNKVEGIKEIINDEEQHEKELIDAIDEERLKFVGSIVLGLNDALVELTGALAGLTFALDNAKTVALAGLITGVAAAFSMASSEYLSTKQDSSVKEALQSALYTGSAYLLAVALLILPFLIGLDVKIALLMTILIAVMIIFVFNYYISVAKDLNFKKRFFEMVTISLGVAFISFLFSFIIKAALGV
ncbi:MAG: VIT1/CCC1 transporter family protein [Bacilli bacterium]|nr:VIT1/CCC1 transporter family protein [Bacilli bacterium]